MLEPEHNNNGMNFVLNLFKEGVANFLVKMTFAPIERVQIILQTQDAIQKIQEGKIMKYKGIFNCFYRIFKEEGLRSFWRGNLASVLRYYPPQVLSFTFQDVFKKLICPFDAKKEKTKFFFGNIMSGTMAGATSLLIVYPIDFARTRLGADIGSKSERQFTGLWDCLKQIAQIDGPRGLYRGFGVAVFEIMVYRGIQLGLYDNAKEMLYPLPIMSSNYAKYYLIQAVTITAGFVSYPFWTIQRRMMMESGRNDIERKSVYICIRKIIKREGVTAFYKGYFMNIFKYVGSATFLIMYDTFKEYLIYLKTSGRRD